MALLYFQVCEHGFFDVNALKVACRTMGYAPGELLDPINDELYHSKPLLLDFVKCTGDEPTLNECSHYPLGEHYCNNIRRPYVNMTCDTTGKPTIVEGKYQNALFHKLAIFDVDLSG